MPSIRIGLPVWPHTERLEKSLAAAWAAGASYVEVSLDYPWIYGLRNEEAKALRRAVREWGFEVGIHAPWRDVSLASPIKEVWEASLCLDVAHAYAYYARGGEVSTPDALAHWFDSFKGRVKVLHIHDAKRCGPRCFLEHIPPGTGELDWSWLSQKIRDAGADYLLLEVYRDAEGRRITGGLKEHMERVRRWLKSG